MHFQKRRVFRYQSVMSARATFETSDCPFDTATLRYYADQVAVYAGSGPSGVSRHIPAFLEKMKRGARVLELGCGGGRDAEAMIAFGLDVDPTEGTPEIARLAAARLNREVRVMRFDELDAEAVYDAVYANASLIHVPRSSLPYILGLVFRALKPGGLHFASYKSGGQDGRDTCGRYYNFPSRNDLLNAYRQSGSWIFSEVTEYVGSGFDGGEGPWITIVTCRPFEQQATEAP
jgi:SAM-dependent methyltransferase